jgi:hypothetical protein
MLDRVKELAQVLWESVRETGCDQAEFVLALPDGGRAAVVVTINETATDRLLSFLDQQKEAGLVRR